MRKLLHVARRLGSPAAALLIAMAASPGGATLRAVVIGIDDYGSAGAGGRWQDLRGASNDAEAMRSVLVSRYGFASENVRLLTDASATRQAILTALEEHLVAASKPGDVAVFFYAGHGSQLRNPASTEGDRLDETLVPADSNRGAADIRDKRLRILFNDVLDRGADLVAIFDSCSSGSITRSIFTPKGVRYLPPTDVVAPPVATDPRAAPEERGALIFSASEDGQAAREAVDAGGNYGGSFSQALVRALRESAVDEPAHHVFLRTRAYMLEDRVGQSPVLAGPQERRWRPLFAHEAGDRPPTRPLAAVLRVENDRVLLDAGMAGGVNVGAELVAEASETPLRLRVESMRGIGRTWARVVHGEAALVSQGQLFRLDRWTPPRGAQLRIAVPPSLGFTELAAALEALGPLRERPDVEWIVDPTERTPTHRLVWDGASWWLTSPNEAIDLGRRPRAQGIVRHLPGGEPARLFVVLPPVGELAAALQSWAGSEDALLLVEPEYADYALVGAWRSEGPAYAWVGPEARSDDLQALPPRSDWFRGLAKADVSQAVAGLRETGLRLAATRAWLTLASPPDEGRFPYHLALRNRASGRIVVGGVVFEGDVFDLLLRRDAGGVGAPVERRYVYVFAVGADGGRALIFPPAASGNTGNHLPLAGATQAPQRIALGEVPIRIQQPLGTDTLVLLTSAQPLTDPSILEGSPARTRVLQPVPAGASGLERLLWGLGAQVREWLRPTELGWSVRRISLRSLPAEGRPGDAVM